MATGYTYPIHDGEHASLRRFVLDCSRAMGAAIMQRDDDPSVPIKKMEPSEHYPREIQKIKAQIAEMRERTMDEWAVLEQAYRDRTVIDRKEAFERKALYRSRYEDMLNKVKTWKPPTSEHQGLKDFMIEQIESSIKHDCSEGWEPTVPDPVSAEEYAAKEISIYIDRLAYYEKQWDAEVERIQSQNDWVEALYESVKDIP